jgi:hypothetical protein
MRWNVDDGKVDVRSDHAFLQCIHSSIIHHPSSIIMKSTMPKRSRPPEAGPSCHPK